MGGCQWQGWFTEQERLRAAKIAVCCFLLPPLLLQPTARFSLLCSLSCFGPPQHLSSLQPRPQPAHQSSSPLSLLAAQQSTLLSNNVFKLSYSEKCQDKKEVKSFRARQTIIFHLLSTTLANLVLPSLPPPHPPSLHPP